MTVPFYDENLGWTVPKTVPGAVSTPDETWTKAQIIEWLDAKGIEHSSGANKNDLLELAGAS